MEAGRQMFEQVVFAGGGNRCWWQAGFWEIVAPAIDLRPRAIAAVSAGAATACLLYANDTAVALAYYREALKTNRRNVHLLNALRRGHRVFPHEAIYRKALHTLLGGEHYRRLMWTAPEIRVQFSRIPPRLGPRSAAAIATVGYNVEKYLLHRLHPRFGRWLGFTSEIVRVQDCRNENELVSLIVASSCAPPFTSIAYRDDRPALDGGFVDNVPVDALDPQDGPTLVLTTRRYPQHAPVFVRDGRVYVQPSRKVAASSWDYTSPDAYEATWRQGREDGEAFLRGFPALRVVAEVGSGVGPAAEEVEEDVASALGQAGGGGPA